MKALALMTLMILGSASVALAEKTPTAIDQALLETISENQIQEKNFSQTVTGQEEIRVFEQTGEPTLLHITTGLETLPPTGVPVWELDAPAQQAPVSF
jgi:hypothetical protein